MKANLTKVLFLGSNWEAVESLKTLHAAEGFDVVGVITKEDKPVGRKKEITPNIVKVEAQKLEIPVYHTLNQAARYDEAISKFQPDLVVVKSYGEIIPEAFLNTPKYGAINIHFSLLPKYRGAVPIQKAILNGDSKTGVTFVKMVKELDAGPILETYEEEILPTDTNQSLRERLVKRSSRLLPDVLRRWVAGEIKPTNQDDSQATYCWQKDIAKDNAQIDWTQHGALSIDRMVRAFIPWPVAWFLLPDGKRMKVFKAKVVEINENFLTDESFEQLYQSCSVGDLFKFQKRLFAKTLDNDKLIELLEVQKEGKTRVSGFMYMT